MLELSVIIPFYNEEENIAPMVREVQQALDGKYSYEIVAVDDGSKDKTLENLKRMCEEIPQLRVTPHSINRGQSTAIVSGVRSARAPLIATLDGDGQNDPADIPVLLAACELDKVKRGEIMVAGNRRKRNDSWLRRMSSRIANGVRRSLLKDECSDTGCGLKIFSRDTFLLLPHFDHLHRFLPALFQRAGGHVMNVPVNHRPRMRGKSKYGVGNRLWVGIVDLFGVMWLQRRPCLSEKSNESE